VTSGARVRQIPRDEAEIAVECLRDWGFSARILARTPQGEPPSERGATKAAYRCLCRHALGCTAISSEYTLDRSSGQSGYFRSCSAYFDNGQFTVLARHRRNPRLRRPFPLFTLDPPTMEVDHPQNYEGFVPFAPMCRVEA
jgi:hypothetical protein